MDSFYLYSNSELTQLAKTIHFEGHWEVALTEIHIEHNNISPRHFAVVANFVDTSPVNNTSLPVLRWVHSLKVEFNHLYYKPVSVNRLSGVEVKLLSHSLGPVNCKVLDFVLHFRKK